MKIKAKIDRMVNSGNVKAIASVSLDGMFVVKNLKVMDGKKGLFVSMPQETYSGKDGQKKYSNLFFALTNSAKLELQETVLQAYQQQIDPNYTPKRSYEEQGILQEVQHQREYYPQPPYPEPQYPDWVNDCDDGMPTALVDLIRGFLISVTCLCESRGYFLWKGRPNDSKPETLFLNSPRGDASHRHHPHCLRRGIGRGQHSVGGSNLRGNR